MNMTSLYVSLTIFLLVAAAATALYAAIFGTRRIFEDRIADIAVKMRVTYGNPTDAEINSDSFARGLFRWIVRHLPEPELDVEEAEKLQGMMSRAGFNRPDAVRTFNYVRLGLTAFLAVLALVVAILDGARGIKPIMAALVGGAGGLFIPLYYLKHRGGDRQRAISCQLSDILDLLVVCVEAGLGLSEAIKIVGVESERQQQAIGSELAIVSGELSAGATLGQALRNLAARTAVEDIKPLSATLIQSEQLGAQVGPALRSISDTLRNSRRIRAEEAAQKTTVKILFPLVLFVLPAMMSVIVGPAMLQVLRALSQ
jgi:tight adherence protein C